MTDFTILMYEDDSDYKDSFQFNLEPRLALQGRSLIIHHLTNADSLEQDLLMVTPDLLLIDHDLGETTGEEIIEIINGMPEYRRVSIFYYSGGETLEDLRTSARKYQCNIRCFPKEGGELDSAIIGLIM